MKDLGAVFGQKFGWERANFFASRWSWSKKMIGLLEDQNGLKCMEKECRNVKENVGLTRYDSFRQV